VKCAALQRKKPSGGTNDASVIEETAVNPSIPEIQQPVKIPA